jgi:hypothetical protein
MYDRENPQHRVYAERHRKAQEEVTRQFREGGAVGGVVTGPVPVVLHTCSLPCPASHYDLLDRLNKGERPNGATVEVTTADVLHDLARAKATFQLRAVKAAMGLPEA